MGFLDRVKASFSQAVGGKTALQLEVTPAAVAAGETVEWRLVLVTSGPLKADRILVGLEGRERVRVWVGAPPAGGAGPAERLSDAPPAGGWARETITFQQAEPVGNGEVILPAGQTREYQGRLQVPATVQPTYRGVDAQHTWRVRAVVEIPLGVDLIEEREILVR